ncbi:MAG: type II toxin-antitoxin system RelE/ParE family toxin [Cyclobacteriaceae bacterium]
MANYRLTNLAVEDLASIWNYTFDNWSETQADYYYQQLIESFEKIAKKPNSGKNYNGIAKDLFGFQVNRHIVFYRTMKSDEVEIARILHERMDLKSRLE